MKTKDWVEQLSQGVREGAQQVGTEIKRLAVQGQTELASGLYQGTANGFVPYGVGQDIQRFDRGRGRDM